MDLWSLGVILYELFVGQPPFYTTSIYTLIKQIVREPVRYPEGMSPHFLHFLQVRACGACALVLWVATLGRAAACSRWRRAALLLTRSHASPCCHSPPRGPQGLLEKQPSLRLDWPALLDHPFLAETAEDKQRAEREAAREAASRAVDAGATPTLASRVQGGAAGAGQASETPQIRGLPGAEGQRRRAERQKQQEQQEQQVVAAEQRLRQQQQQQQRLQVMPGPFQAQAELHGGEGQQWPYKQGSTLQGPFQQAAQQAAQHAAQQAQQHAQQLREQQAAAQQQVQQQAQQQQQNQVPSARGTSGRLPQTAYRSS